MMSRAANDMKHSKESQNSDASLRLENKHINQIPAEIFEIAELLARIAVDEYFTEIKQSNANA